MSEIFNSFISEVTGKMSKLSSKEILENGVYIICQECWNVSNTCKAGWYPTERYVVMFGVIVFIRLKPIAPFLDNIYLHWCRPESFSFLSHKDHLNWYQFAAR